MGGSQKPDSNDSSICYHAHARCGWGELITSTMAHQKLKLGVLDQSPMAEHETASDALAHTIELAQRTEDRGQRTQKRW